MNLELIKLLLAAFRKNPHSYHLPSIAECFDFNLNYIRDEKHISWIAQTLEDILSYTDEFNELYKLSDKNKTREHLKRMKEIAPLIGNSTDVLEMGLDNDEWIASAGLNLPELKINEKDTK